MFEFAVERQSALIAIVRQQRRQIVDFAEAGLARQDRKSVATVTTAVTEQ